MAQIVPGMSGDEFINVLNEVVDLAEESNALVLDIESKTEISYLPSSNLQEIIDASEDDVVYLKLTSGTFVQNIVTDKKIVLKGNSRSTFFDGTIQTSNSITAIGIDFITTQPNVILFLETASIDGVFIDDCIFTNFGKTDSNAIGALLFNNSEMNVTMSNVRVTNTIFKDCGTGIRLGFDIRNVIISNCIFTDIYNETRDVRGIYLGGNDNYLVAENFQVSNCLFKNISTGQQSLSGSTAGVLLYGTKATVSNCLFENISGIGAEGLYGKCGNSIIIGCEFRNCINDQLQFKDTSFGKIIVSDCIFYRSIVQGGYDIYIDGDCIISNIKIIHDDCYGEGIRVLATDTAGIFQINNVDAYLVGGYGLSVQGQEIVISNVKLNRNNSTDRRLATIFCDKIFINNCLFHTADYGLIYAMGSEIKITNSEFIEETSIQDIPSIALFSDNLVDFIENKLTLKGIHQSLAILPIESVYPNIFNFKGNKIYIQPSEARIEGSFYFRGKYINISDNYFEFLATYSAIMNSGIVSCSLLKFNGNQFIDNNNYTENYLFSINSTLKKIEISDNYFTDDVHDPFVFGTSISYTTLVNRDNYFTGTLITQLE